jgi:glycosyltransferase involved in cell wall biosynthesis
MSSICMYVPSAGGGHARYAKEFLTALSAHPRNTYRHELLSSSDLREEFRTELYPVHPYLRPLRPPSEFRFRGSWVASRLTHYIRREMEFLAWLKEQPDVVAVHFQEWAPWLAASLIRRIKAQDKKVFATVHNIVPHKYPRLLPKFVMNAWNRSACLLCDGIFVHTDQLAERLEEFLGRPHPPIHVLPHGVWTVDDAQLDASLPSRIASRKLLFFGAIRRNKGLDLLLDAMSELRGYSLTIAGEALERDYFHGEILPRVDRLRAAGAQIDLRAGFTPEEQIGELFQTHSAVVLPYTQGFVAQSGVVFMALAYELPVIASKAGGLSDLFSQFQIGVTFENATTGDLVSAVNKLHNEIDPQFLLDQIHAAKRKFSWQNAAAVALAAYGSAEERGEVADESELETNLAH